MKPTPLDSIAGFQASNWRALVRIGRTRYRVGADGVVAIKLAVKILRMSEEHRPLFGLRGAIRSVRKTMCKAALTHLAVATENEKLALIAIWLRGQCGGYLGMEVLAKFASADSEAVRLKVAKALQRMSGWGVLQQMSVNDPSPRVRRIAASPAPREFQSRLNQFVDNSSTPSVEVNDTLPKRGLYIADNFKFTPPKEFKSVEFIRTVLERIRLLVNVR